MSLHLSVCRSDSLGVCHLEKANRRGITIEQRKGLSPLSSNAETLHWGISRGRIPMHRYEGVKGTSSGSETNEAPPPQANTTSAPSTSRILQHILAHRARIRLLDVSRSAGRCRARRCEVTPFYLVDIFSGCRGSIFSAASVAVLGLARAQRRRRCGTRLA